MPDLPTIFRESATEPGTLGAGEQTMVQIDWSAVGFTPLHVFDSYDVEGTPLLWRSQVSSLTLPGTNAPGGATVGMQSQRWVADFAHGRFMGGGTNPAIPAGPYTIYTAARRTETPAANAEMIYLGSGMTPVLRVGADGFVRVGSIGGAILDSSPAGPLPIDVDTVTSFTVNVPAKTVTLRVGSASKTVALADVQAAAVLHPTQLAIGLANTGLAQQVHLVAAFSGAHSDADHAAIMSAIQRVKRI